MAIKYQPDKKAAPATKPDKKPKPSKKGAKRGGLLGC
jgi:hypothetical protein